MREITDLTFQFLPADDNLGAFLSWEATIDGQKHGQVAELGKVAVLSQADLEEFVTQALKFIETIRRMTPEQVAEAKAKTDRFAQQGADYLNGKRAEPPVWVDA